jgi:hypothetical protein
MRAARRAVVTATILAMAGAGRSARADTVDAAHAAVVAAQSPGGATAVGSPLAAGKGLAITADEKNVMVNKDVGADRWAITWGSPVTRMSGNVFSPSGVSFLDCQIVGITGDDLYTDSMFLTCDGGAGLVPPDGWRRVATGIELPLSFFLP